ncbi:hypothetical protein [Leifsonia sp. Leaf336]|uniref:hypothetical protein n=1 Tax=Leifsonia sp. Leaf336 TaxID=1736341 RepID=UPI0012F88FD5|nr:hypothetical protein [Leifsonia sp. Leaf336]
MSLGSDRRWRLLDEVEAVLAEMYGSRGVTRTRFVGAFPELPGAGVWLCTTTDVERDALRSDLTLVDSVMAVMRSVGFSSTDIARSDVVVESQESVDRETEGSWFFRMR